MKNVSKHLCGQDFINSCFSGTKWILQYLSTTIRFWNLDYMHQEASLRLVKLGVVFHIVTSFPTRKDHYNFLFPIILKFHFTPLLTPE